MATTNYMTLTNSDASLAKKFKAIHGSYRNTLSKAQDIKRLVDGQLDVSVGSIQERYEMVLKVRDEEDVSGFGTRHDLETFYRYNDPGGSPSNVITLLDHFGDTKSIIMDGEFTPEPLSVVIEGTEAYFLIKVLFHVMPEGS